MEITNEFWDFIEANVPNYRCREDVLRQADLQAFIDSGDETHIKGVTREEAITERDRIHFGLFAEAIDNFTRNDEKHKELVDKLCEIRNDEELCGCLAETFFSEALTGAQPLTQTGMQLIDAYLSRDCDLLLTALCRRSMASLVDNLQTDI